MRYEFFKVGNKTVGYDITLDESIGRGAFAYLLTFALFTLIGGVFATILPLALSIVYLFNNDRKAKLFTNIGVILFSTYFLIDYNQGWVCYKIFNSFEALNLLKNVAILNLGLLITNLILLIHNLLKPETENTILINKLQMVLIFGLSIYMFRNLITNNIIKQYVEPPKTEQQIKEEHNRM